MNIEIFDISEGKITINTNCLLIPELKAIYDTYPDSIPPFCFVHYMTDPLGPYANIEEAKREEILLEDYVGDYTVDDEPIYKAIEKLKILYETPTMRLLRRSREGLDNLGEYISKAKITDGRDSNLQAYTTALTRIGKISQEFRSLETEVQEELKTRGNANLGYDEV